MEELEVENIVNPPSEQKTLDLLAMPHTTVDAYIFFKFMRENISLESSGMDGVKLRESKAALKSLMKEEGYKWKYYKGFIARFEQKTLQNYYDKRENDKK